MNTARTSRNRVATVFVATISMLLTFVVPAFASDVELADVDVICDAGTPTGLSYTAFLNDRTDEQTTTATALVEWKLSSSNVDAYEELQTLELTTANNFTAVGSTSPLDFLGADSADVRVTITASDNQAPDRNGRDKVTGDTYVLSVDLTTCQQETDPATASAAADCSSEGGVIVVTFENPTAAAVDYAVTIIPEAGGAVAYPFSQDPGTGSESYPATDGEYTVVVTAAGETVEDVTVEIECDADPSATADGVCLTTGAIDVELSNPDPTPATFVISIDGDVVDTITVTDGIESVVFPADTGDHNVLITVDGEVILDTVVDVDCNNEVLNVVFEVGCDELTGLGTFQATLTNDGPATTAQVLVDGEIVADVDVDANSVANFTVALPNGLSQVVVVSNGKTISTAPIEVDCAQPVEPDPIVTHECQTPLNGSYTVTVENPSDVETREVVVTMTDADGVVVVDETTSIAPSGSTSINAPVDNGTYVLNVSFDGTELLNESVDVQCTEVLGVSLTNNPQELPATGQELPAAGAATVAWLLLALLLMFFGADVLLSGELRRRLAMMRA